MSKELIDGRFPKKAKYKRFKNRIYFLGDFEDGEIIEFAHFCEKPSADAIGNVFYRSEKEQWKKHLVNIEELEAI